MHYGTSSQPPLQIANRSPLRPPLTKEQYNVLVWLTRDLTAKEIASELKISESAAKHRIEKLKDKFHVRKTSQLAYLAWQYLRDVKGPTLKSRKTAKQKE